MQIKRYDHLPEEASWIRQWKILYRGISGERIGCQVEKGRCAISTAIGMV